MDEKVDVVVQLKMREMIVVGRYRIITRNTRKFNAKQILYIYLEQVQQCLLSML
jgi:hypothetical protein